MYYNCVLEGSLKEMPSEHSEGSGPPIIKNKYKKYMEDKDYDKF